MKRIVLFAVCAIAAAVAFGGRLSLQEHAAVQVSPSCVHPRMQAKAV